MSKSWRKPRQVLVNQAPPEIEDAQRFERLVKLLSIGIARLASQKKTNTDECVDFQRRILLNMVDEGRR